MINLFIIKYLRNAKVLKKGQEDSLFYFLT